MESIAAFFKEENDILYRRGFKKGFENTENGRRTMGIIARLIEEFNMPEEKIAKIMDVPLFLVKSVRDDLNK